MQANNIGMLSFLDGRSGGWARTAIEERHDIYELSYPDWEVGRVNILLLGTSKSTIDYIVLAKTETHEICTVNAFVNLSAIPVRAIKARLNKQLQRYFVMASRGDDLLMPLPELTEIVDAVKAERPSLAGDIERLFSCRRYSGLRLVGGTALARAVTA